MLDLDKTIDIVALLLTATLLACFVIFEVINGGRYIFLALSIILFFLKTKGRIEMKLEPYIVFNLLMIIYTAINSLWALDPALTLFMAKRLTVTFACFVLVYFSYSQEKNTTLLMSAFKWSGYIVMIYTIKYYGINRLVNMLLDSERMNGEIGNSNLFGIAIAYGCIFELIEIANKKRPTLSCVLLIPAFLVISVTQSRKAILIIIVGTILVFCAYFIDVNNMFKTIFHLVVFCIIACLLTTFFKNSVLFSGIYKRLTYLINYTIGNGEVGSSIKARDLMIKYGLEQFFKNPIGGVGIGNAKLVLLLYGNIFYDYLHNNYIELLCCGGIIGFLIYYSRFAFMLLILVKNVWNKSKDFFPCIIIMVLILVFDYGHVTYYVKSDQIYYVLLFLQIKNIAANRLPESTIREKAKYQYIKY